MEPSSVADEVAAAAQPPSPGELAGMFALEPAGDGAFRSRGIPGERRRLFGGHLVALALAAAGHTVTGARPHSLHAYFLHAGHLGSPVTFDVERIQDGRTFARRRVTGLQDGEPVVCLESSFTSDDLPAADYLPPPEVPGPDDCAPYRPVKRIAGRLSPWNLLEGRAVPGQDVPYDIATTRDSWFRFAGGGPAGVRSEVLITYLSDLTLAAALLRPTRSYPQGRPDIVRATSLDHCVWFHNQANLGDWLLYEKLAPAATAVRGMITGRIFNRDGTLVASVTQEALLHARRPGRQGADRSE